MDDLLPFPPDRNDWPQRPPLLAPEAERRWHAEADEILLVTQARALRSRQPYLPRLSAQTRALERWLRLHSDGEAS
jgi:hypothetical protein